VVETELSDPVLVAVPMTSQVKNPGKILPLTSVRFLAAIYVVCYHTVDRVFVHYRDLATIHGRLLDLGYVSVSFFFTLSGYILAVSYLPRTVAKGQFWWARFARIYPLFLITLLLDAPQFLIGVTKEIGFHAASRVVLVRLIANIFLLQAWLPALRGIDWPNWSISVEAFFYLVFPFFITWAARFRVRNLGVVATAVYLSGMIGVFVSMHAPISLDVLKFNPLLHLHAFVLGIFVGVARAKRNLNPAYAPALLGVAVACFALTVTFYAHIPHPLIHDGMLAPAFSCAILALDSHNKVIDAFLSFKWLVILGEASYGLYLIHIPLWHVFYHLRLDQSPVAYPAYIVCAVGLSVLSFFFVETPLRLFLTPKTGTIAPRQWRMPQAKEEVLLPPTKAVFLSSQNGAQYVPYSYEVQAPEMMCDLPVDQQPSAP
jgi:peptidoglycan/LPS O-acetylase OafA/YrhL